ncbi:unnamed protein product [Chrysoparadoxa australica]
MDSHTSLDETFYWVEGAPAASDMALALSFAPDGTQLVIGGYTRDRIPNLGIPHFGSRDFVVVMLDAWTEKVLWSGIPSTDKLDQVNSVAFSPDGKQVVIGCTSSSSPFGQEASGQEDALAIALDAETGEIEWSKQFGSPARDLVLGGAYSSDGTFVVLTGYTDGIPWENTQEEEQLVTTDFMAVALDTETGAELWHWHQGSNAADFVFAVAISPDSSSIVLGGATSGDYAGLLEGEVDFAAVMLDRLGNQLWAWQRGAIGESSFQAAAFHPDGSMVVLGGFTEGSFAGESSGDRDFVAVALNAADGEELWTWQGGSDALDTVTGVVYAPDGKFVVLCGSTLSSMQGNPSAGVVPAVAIALESSSGAVLWTWEGQFGGSSPVSWVNGCALAPGGGKLFMAGYSSSSWLNPYNAPANANLAVVALTGPALGPEPLPPAGPAPATPTVEMATAILGEKVNSFVEEEEAAFLAAVTSLGGFEAAITAKSDEVPFVSGSRRLQEAALLVSYDIIGFESEVEAQAAAQELIDYTESGELLQKHLEQLDEAGFLSENTATEMRTALGISLSEVDGVTDGGGKGGMDAGVIVAIVIGSLVGVLALLWVYCKWMRQTRAKAIKSKSDPGLDVVEGDAKEPELGLESPSRKESSNAPAPMPHSLNESSPIKLVEVPLVEAVAPGAGSFRSDRTEMSARKDEMSDLLARLMKVPCEVFGDACLPKQLSAVLEHMARIPMNDPVAESTRHWGLTMVTGIENVSLLLEDSSAPNKQQLACLQQVSIALEKLQEACQLNMGGNESSVFSLRCDSAADSLADCLNSLRHVIPASDIKLEAHPMAAGGSATVYFGDYRGLNVAAKVLDASEHRETAFLNELRNLKKLQHECIVTIYGASRMPVNGKDSLVLVMEYLSEGNLHEYVKKNAEVMTPGEDMGLMRDIASAMEFVHLSGIQHRDLKPANILLTRKGSRVRAKVADFGLSKMSEQGTTLLNLRGFTPVWSAPEVLRMWLEGGESKRSFASDVFSFGVVVFEIVTKERPWKDMNLRGQERILSVSMQVLNGERPVIPPSVAPGMRSLIEDCWAQNIGDRPTFTKVMEGLIDTEWKGQLLWNVPVESLSLDSGFASSGGSVDTEVK